MSRRLTVRDEGINRQAAEAAEIRGELGLPFAAGCVEDTSNFDTICEPQNFLCAS
jgi:hypothetical protein